MKKLNIFVFVMLIAVGSMFAQEQVVDVTGNNFTHDEYVGTYGRQILVADNGDVHVVYQKSWATTDTAYNITWKNITTGATDVLPYQPAPTETDPRPDPGVAYIGGGTGAAPVYFYYGNGGWTYKWGDMHHQAMAKVKADGSGVEALGTQDDKNYYHQPYYANPISMEVSGTTGIAHCILTNVGGDAVGYWNFDGTNFGEIYQMYFVDAANDVPGKNVPGKYRRNAADGADLALNSDGSEVTIAGLHKASNIWLHKGIFGGELWDDDFFVAMDNGTCVGLWDTTGVDDRNNIPETEPKPYTDVQVVYDENDQLCVAYVATYVSHHADTSRLLGDWTFNHTSSGVGDTSGSFYDGSVHPKLQLRFWSEASGTHSQIVESTYPMAGTTINAWEDGVLDSGRAFVGQGINDAFISHFNMISNKDAVAGEPKLVIAFQMAVTEPTLASTGYEAWGDDYMRWLKYSNDIFVIRSYDGATWADMENVTDTPDKNEVDVSIHRDVVDGKIHMLYFRSNEAGTDDWQSGTDTGGVVYANAVSVGNWGIPVRLDQANQVEVIYNVWDVTTGVDDAAVPGKFELAQNYPNPFNPSTTISYSIPARSDVNIKVYNNLGQLVTTLFDGVNEAGTHNVSWNAANVSTGVYFYSINAGDFTSTKKMILLK